MKEIEELIEKIIVAASESDSPLYDTSELKSQLLSLYAAKDSEIRELKYLRQIQTELGIKLQSANAQLEEKVKVLSESDIMFRNESYRLSGLLRISKEQITALQSQLESAKKAVELVEKIKEIYNNDENDEIDRDGSMIVLLKDYEASHDSNREE
jgi:small-conductance mechanosensitive channel